MERLQCSVCTSQWEIFKVKALASAANAAGEREGRGAFAETPLPNAVLLKFQSGNERAPAVGDPPFFPGSGGTGSGERGAEASQNSAAAASRPRPPTLKCILDSTTTYTYYVYYIVLC